MNHHTRMAVSLVFSLVVSAGNLHRAALGEVDIVAVGLRWVAAFLAAFVAVGAAGRVFAQYIRDSASPEPDHDTDDDSGTENAEPAFAVALEGDHEVPAERG